MAVYEKATPDEIDGWMSIGKDWFENQNPGRYFTSSRNSAIAAIAEFLANQQGKTLSNNASEEVTPLKSA